MNRRGELLGPQKLREVFDELSDVLSGEGMHAQLFVVGGAAMALAYDAQRVTRDVDALFEPKAELRKLTAAVGERYGLEADWLNDAAKGFMPGADDSPQTVYESESLLVQVPSPEYLLAMKLYASRDERDLDDAARLANIAGVTSPSQGIELLQKKYPLASLLPRHRFILDEVMERAAFMRDAPR